MSFNLEDYEPVAVRLDRFWEEHPNGRIKTTLEVADPELGLYRVLARVWKDRNLHPTCDATGWAQETTKSLGTMASSILEVCVGVDTPVLTKDLRWVPAGKLAFGDELLGFDESLPGTGRHRRFQNAMVTSHRITPRRVMRVELESGRSFLATPEHRLLVASAPGRGHIWRRVDKLLVGTHRGGMHPRPEVTIERRELSLLVPRISQVQTRAAGWLAGFLDGEGYIGPNRSLAVSQVLGSTWETAVRSFLELGFDIRQEPVRRPTAGRYQPTGTIRLLGGHWAQLEAVMALRPERLVDKLSRHLNGSAITSSGGPLGQTQRRDAVVAVVEAGVEEVAVMETSTGTFIADGLPHHNCETSAIGRALANLGYQTKKSGPGGPEIVRPSREEMMAAAAAKAAEQRAALAAASPRKPKDA